MDDTVADICRVCRSEESTEKPLYHPCVCTGSIRYIHQECLLQWLKYSRKEFCELCKHRFSFTPIYSPDMPKRLPIFDIFNGLIRSIIRAVRYWLHYTLVAFAWIGVVPLMACRIYRCLFTGSVSSLLTLPLDMLSTDNLVTDCLRGFFIVICTLCAFISLVWLREQILHGGGPDWLEQPGQLNNHLGGEVRGNGNAGNLGQGQPNQNEAEERDSDSEDDDGLDISDDESDNGDVLEDINNEAQDDINWNPIEWDRAAEELTWERLLGLDGSLVFLEHVFWVVSLNTLFILVFAFCPYHIGHFTIAGFKLIKWVEISQFEGLVTTLSGYSIIAMSLVVLHFFAGIARFNRSKRVIGLCYLVVKVSLLVVVEIGIFPLICGWWLDICSLALFNSNLKDRQRGFQLTPGTSMFIHWLVGMVYVFYFASFILLLREVLRPGVLWFLRNLNDPDFNPIQEMIHLRVLRHIRRFLASIVIFGMTVLLMLWLPVQVIKYIKPKFLPYSIMLSSDAPVSELSLELLLLQVVLPALLEQGHTRTWLKGLVRGWTVGVAWLLNLKSYLIGDDEPRDGNAHAQHAPDVNPAQGLGAVHQAAQHAPDVNPAQGLGAVHQAMLQGAASPAYQPYSRPSFFYIRMTAMLILMCLTLFIASFVTLTLPVFIGRQLMALWMADTQIHELYTAASGLYVCWILMRSGSVLYHWLPQGWHAICFKVKEWTCLAVKSFVVALILIGVVPLMLGLLFELVVVAPLRVPLDQTPVFFPWQDWALGVLHTKIICAMTLMGPHWWLQRVIERVYNDGLRNMNIQFILTRLCAPVFGVLGVALSLPYITVHSFIPLLGFDEDVINIVERRIYPTIITTVVLSAIIVFQVKQFKRLYEHIKNDKYLVGQRLVNYDQRTEKLVTSQHTLSQPLGGVLPRPGEVDR